MHGNIFSWLGIGSLPGSRFQHDVKFCLILNTLCSYTCPITLIVGLIIIGAFALPCSAIVEIVDSNSTKLRLAYQREIGKTEEVALVGLPPTGDVSLTLVETYKNTNSSANIITGPVWIDEVGLLRGQRIAKVVFGPADLSNKQRLSYDRIVVDVNFAPANITTKSRLDRWSETLFRRLLVNHDQARSWYQVPKSASFKLSLQNKSTQRWRIFVKEEGIHRISFGELQEAGMKPSGVASEQLRIYYGGGKALPLVEPTDPVPVNEIAVIIEDGGDGHFSDDDYLLFYGEAVNRWEYNVDSEDYHYRKNLYTRENIYFLIVDSVGEGMRAKTRSGTLTDANPFIPTSYRERLHAEKEKSILVQSFNQNSGYDWYWMEFRRSARNFLIEIPDAAKEPIGLKFGFFGVTTNTHRFDVRWNNTLIGNIEFRSVPPSQHEITTDAVPLVGTNLLGLVQQNRRTARLDWYEVEYSRRFVAHEAQLKFTGPQYDGTVEFHLEGFEERPHIFEIGGNAGGLSEITDVTWDDNIAQFQDRANQRPRHYIAIHPGRWKKPVRIEIVVEGDLNLSDLTAEYLVISPQDFIESARRLAAWRETDERFGPPMASLAIDVQEIYDRFSGGLIDPAAIRNFIHFAWHNSDPPPFFVTLLGDGSYDYKNNSGLNPKNWIPAYQEGASTFDEWYVRVVGADKLPDLAIGRLPVNTEEEAADVVDKLITYDSNPEPGPWQSRILLVADDFRNPNRPDLIETEFLLDAELLVENSLPPELDLRKLYLVEFPLEGRTKPAARDEFIRLFNEGALIVNYLGHGNPDVLAHEQMFVLSRDWNKIANGGRLPLIFTAASQVGPFDRLTGPTIPEQMVTKSTSGAIGMISATRIGFHTSNMLLANQFHKQMFRNDRKHVPVGMALMESKQLVTTGTFERLNIQRYSLFGDPATYLAKPPFKVAIDVNDTLRALEEIVLSGQVLNEKGAPVSNYSGKVELHVFDSAALSQMDTVLYERLGTTLFRGITTVENGVFQARFRVPKDITYRGAKGRITAYAWNATDLPAFGLVGDLVLTGTAFEVETDEAGPAVQIGFHEKPDFKSGDSVGQRPLLLVKLSDPSGINVTGSTGHNIELVVDRQVFLLTKYYTPKENSYQQGTIEFLLPELEPGEHALSLRAWDNFNNTTSESITFTVEINEPEITRLLFYPNPVSSIGHFTFHSDVSLDKVQVEIFTLNGKLVEEFESDAVRGYNQIEWQPQTTVANGSYLGRITAVGNEKQQVKKTTVVVVMK